MKQFSYVLTRPAGMHARPVGKLLREAARFKSSIRVSDGMKAAALEKAAAVMGLDLHSGSRITVTVEGRDEEAAVAAMQAYFVANF